MRIAAIRIAVLGAALAALVGLCQAGAEPTEISARRATERKTFTDAEILDGFFKIAFGAEMHLQGRVDRIRKYEGPVRVLITSNAKPDRRDIVVKAIADIKNHVANLDIEVTQDPDEANIRVSLIRERDFPNAVRKLYGKHARRILKSLDPQCLSGFRKDKQFRITGSDVILVSDVDEFTFRDCVYEEMLQSLGPINDDSSVPWTMFNDDVQMGFFDIYDQFLLNLLYHPSIRPGMTKDEVRAKITDMLPSVRDWIIKVNGLSK